MSRKNVHSADMLTSQRKDYILKILKKNGQVIAKSLSHELGLSEDTIRRDLRELASEGRLQRVHGGALPSSPAVVDFVGRQQLATDAKVAIGKAAATMVRPGQVVILDGGTTTLQLVEHPTVEVVLIGGRLFKHSIVTVGAAAVEAIGRIRADLYFMGVTGIHPEAGLSTGDLEESHIKRALSNSAAETYVLISAEKLNAASPYVIAELSEVDGIIVEAGIPAAA